MPQDRTGSSGTTGTTGSSGAGSAAGGDPGSEQSRMGKAKEFVSDKYASASEKVKDSYSAVRERVDDIDIGEVTEQMRGFVRSNPGKALLISVGVGFVLGMLLRRGDEDDEE